MSDFASMAASLFAKPPPVSVVIGNFNQSAFVEAAIRSVAAQSYENFDCVVVDDNSSDDSADRIRDCLAALGDKRFRFIPRDTNGGQMTAMLTGMDATSAPFIAFLDGDDVWHSDFLERHLAAHFSRFGAAAVSCSDLALIDNVGTIVAGGHPVFRKGDPRRADAKQQISCVAGEGDETLVFIDRGASNWIWSTTSGMVFRRIVLEVMRPGNPEEIRICADAYLALAAHMLGGSVRLERVLGCYRLHAANSWATDRFFGQGSELGQMTRASRKVIRESLADRLIAVAPKMEEDVSRRYLRRMVVSQIGWAEAFALYKSNPLARDLLADWARPPRRVLLELMHLVPRPLRSRRYPDPPNAASDSNSLVKR
jgi:glycosyltransferase involved in cell wall biosynthesis